MEQYSIDPRLQNIKTMHFGMFAWKLEIMKHVTQNS